MKYYISVSKEAIVEAKSEKEALEKFWEDWEESCAMANTTAMQDMNEEVRVATKKEIEELGD